MTDASLVPEKILFYGKDEQLPQQRLLKAGPLEVIYENGTLRYIRLKGFEVLRMIYPAVRDQNWGTVLPVMKNEKVVDGANSFLIAFDSEYNEGDIHFVSNYRIEGTENGEISFEMKGQALTSFKKNRIGFCVLHPVNECMGKDCEIIEETGKKIRGVFPEQVSPHQPFKNIKSMRWQLPDNNIAELVFSGETFEMEDQRNWTDASYKIYGTPLEIPFPVKVPAGTKIDQVVKLSLLETPQSNTAVSEQDEAAVFEFSLNPGLRLPPIGIGRSTEISGMSPDEVEILADVGFNHYRIDVRLYKEGWKREFNEAAGESQQLNLDLEIALHLSKERWEAGLHDFIQECTLLGAAVYAIVLFQEGKKTTPVPKLQKAFESLRKAFPKIKIGGGTDAYFAEINRQRPSVGMLDFLAFSINPQVHAFDNASLIETLEAQSYVMQSAQKIASGKPVHITPVTFKPRFNPNATEPEPEPLPGQLSAQTDVRQMSLFGAGWTLGSLKYLSESGARSLTFFETVGTKGIMRDENRSSSSPKFMAPHKIFPIYAVFKDVLEFSGAEVLSSKSNKPLQFDGIVLKKGNDLRILLVNFLNSEIMVSIPAVEGRITFRQLDSACLRNEDWLNVLYTNSSIMTYSKENNLSVVLHPFAIITIDIKNALERRQLRRITK